MQTVRQFLTLEIDQLPHDMKNLILAPKYIKILQLKFRHIRKEIRVWISEGK